jgi:hypothetical protein
LPFVDPAEREDWWFALDPALRLVGDTRGERVAGVTCSDVEDEATALGRFFLSTKNSLFLLLSLRFLLSFDPVARCSKELIIACRAAGDKDAASAREADSRGPRRTEYESASGLIALRMDL